MESLSSLLLMNNQFKIGDSVLFKKEAESGVVIRINSAYKVTVLTSEGFELNVSNKDIIFKDENTNKAIAYGDYVHRKDKVTTQRVSSKQQRSLSVLKVDLHIELLTKNYQYLDNFEIVQIQLNECQDKIEKALNSNVEKLIIVHGIGTGVLKSEVHKILRHYKLRFFLSKDAGATEVML